MAGALVWPPRKEDLERLYLVEKLSAMKIARAYGLEYASPKTAEATVLYHLKKHGIQRRDPAAHVRKVTPEMVDEWVMRYQNGESLSEIGAGFVSGATVWNNLKGRGIALRDRIDAQIRAVTKYERAPFHGNSLEKWYMVGLRYGDLHAVQHGRAIRLRVSTTHPAMANLFAATFGTHGHVAWYPRRAKLTGHEWTLECDLDKTFDFLLSKATPAQLESAGEDEFRSFLAGLFDAEGTLHLHRKQKWWNPELYVSSTDSVLLGVIARRLELMGYHPFQGWQKQPQERMGIVGKGIVGRVEVTRVQEAQKMAEWLPIRHSEKRRKRELMLALGFPSGSKAEVEVAAIWKELSREIKAGVRQFVQASRDAIEVYPSRRKRQKKFGLSPKRNSELEMSASGRPPRANSSIPSR